MPRVVWNGKVVAESDDSLMDNGAVYFRKEEVRTGNLFPSGVEGRDASKGHTIHYDLSVGGLVEQQAAWEYVQSTDATKHLAGWIGFKRHMVEGAARADKASHGVH